MSQQQYISSTFSKYCTGYYGFGFNGQEKDQEIYNNQSTTTAMFWEYDGRIGRRWNLDPKPQINMSDYSCFGNNPIVYNDLLGNKKDWYQNKDTKKYEYFQGSEEHAGYDRVGNDDHFGEMLPTTQVLDLSTEHPVAKNHILYTAYTRNKYRKDIAQGGFKINTQHQLESQWVKDFRKSFGTTLIVGMAIPLAGGVLAPNMAEIAPTIFSHKVKNFAKSFIKDVATQYVTNGFNFNEIDWSDAFVSSTIGKLKHGWALESGINAFVDVSTEEQKFNKSFSNFAFKAGSNCFFKGVMGANFNTNLAPVINNATVEDGFQIIFDAGNNLFQNNIINGME